MFGSNGPIAQGLTNIGRGTFGTTEFKGRSMHATTELHYYISVCSELEEHASLQLSGYEDRISRLLSLPVKISRD
jgi:hypothetical protein